MTRARHAKIEIIPAILPKDFAELVDKVEKVNSLVQTVQVDICDGHFVPSFTWPYKKHDDSFEKMLSEEEGLPFWQNLDYEFDLMIDKPEEKVEDFVQIGAKRIIIHAEAKGSVAGAIEALKGRVEVGLALNIDTPIESISKIVGTTKLTDSIQLIQLMGIDKIGYQGQKFDDKVIEKIKEVRKFFPDLPISIDGGVSLETASDLIAAGANRLIVGSAIFDSENIVDTIHKFRLL